MNGGGWVLAAACILIFRMPGLVRFIGAVVLALFFLSWLYPAKAAGEAHTGMMAAAHRCAEISRGEGNAS